MSVNWIGWEPSKNKYVVKDNWQPVAEFATIDEAKSYAKTHGAQEINGILINVSIYDPPREGQPISSVTAGQVADMAGQFVSEEVAKAYADQIGNPALSTALTAAAQQGVSLSNVNTISDVLNVIQQTNEKAQSISTTSLSSSGVAAPEPSGVTDPSTPGVTTPVQIEYNPKIVPEETTAPPVNVTINQPNGGSQQTGSTFYDLLGKLDPSKISTKTIAIVAGSAAILIVLIMIIKGRGKK